MKIPMMVIPAAALALSAVAGCDRDQTPASTTTTTSAEQSGTTKTTSAETTAGAPAPLASDDKDFLTKAAQGGMLEVALGDAAYRKGSSPAVQAFGARMVADHSKSDDELTRLANDKGFSPPTELDKDHQAKLDELSKLSGAKLDKAYARDMVKDHEEDVSEFKKASQGLKDPDLRAWAATTLLTLEEHLDMAKDMEAQTKGQRGKDKGTKAR